MQAYRSAFQWAIIIILSVGLGICLVQYLVAPPLYMATYLVLCAFLLVGLVLAVLLGLRGLGLRSLAVGVILVGLIIGYLANTIVFLNLEEERHLPDLDPPPAAQRDHAAVIYFTHGEPPAYSPMPWIETFKELDADRVSFIPKPFRPFFFLKFREEYLKVGGSPHNYIHQDMARSLKEAFRAEGDQTTRFYMAFLDSNPRPDEAVIRALNEGAKKVVFATVFVTISSHTKAGQDMVNELDLDQYGVPICFSEPLWNSETLQEMFVARANENLKGTSKSKVGILLVGHGQPEDWDRIYPTQTEQEILFRQAIISRLVADGYSEENISLAWMEFKEPEIGEVARALADKGVEKLFVFATSISASSLHSLYDIPEAVVTSGLPKDVEVVNLGAWDDDPIVIQAIKERAQACP
jgi:protoheme ferro-lyase